MSLRRYRRAYRHAKWQAQCDDMLVRLTDGCQVAHAWKASRKAKPPLWRVRQLRRRHL